MIRRTAQAKQTKLITSQQTQLVVVCNYYLRSWQTFGFDFVCWHSSSTAFLFFVKIILLFVVIGCTVRVEVYRWYCTYRCISCCSIPVRNRALYCFSLSFSTQLAGEPLVCTSSYRAAKRNFTKRVSPRTLKNGPERHVRAQTPEKYS